MNEISDMLLSVRPVRNADDLKAVAQAAAADNHKVIAPTQMVMRGDAVVGYASIGAIPLVHTWVDSRRVRARESFGLLNFAENLVANSGVGSLIVPCWEGSPFSPLMERMGYRKLGTTTLWVKGV